MSDVHGKTDSAWLAILAESEVDLAAGKIVPGEMVLQSLRDGLARLDTKLAAQTFEAPPRG